VTSCDIVRDFKTGESLCYGFIGARAPAPPEGLPTCRRCPCLRRAPAPAAGACADAARPLAFQTP
jgi:hypothetical protein